MALITSNSWLNRVAADQVRAVPCRARRAAADDDGGPVQQRVFLEALPTAREVGGQAAGAGAGAGTRRVNEEKKSRLTSGLRHGWRPAREIGSLKNEGWKCGLAGFVF